MTSSCILQIFLWIAIQDQRSVVLSYNKVWDVFRWKQWIRPVFQRIQKSEPFYYREGFGFCCCDAPPGTRTLGPLIKRSQRETIVNFQNCADLLFLSFYREFVFCICCILCTCYPLLHPLSSYSGVQKVCKKCAKMCRVKISPLKQGSDFSAKPGKRPGSSPIWQLQSCLFRPIIKCTFTTTIHGRDLDNCDLL